MLTLFHVLFNQFTILMVSGLAIAFFSALFAQGVKDKQKLLENAYIEAYKGMGYPGGYNAPNVSLTERFLKAVCVVMFFVGAYMFLNNLVGFINGLYVMFS